MGKYDIQFYDYLHFSLVGQRLSLFLKGSGIDVWEAMKLSPSFEPFALFTSIVYIIYSHAVFVSLT